MLSAPDELENAYLVVLNSVAKSLEGKLIGYAKIKPRAMEGDMAMLAEIHHKAAESNRNLKKHSVLFLEFPCDRHLINSFSLFYRHFLQIIQFIEGILPFIVEI
ncbi:hypothetical protein [Sporolactobacillus terrae]|uniref:Uncharacterized protein n=1 Tax=Sporolactobacillus terrae TaxID=269673 RepID=A0A5K7WZ85_9BACL|nr:hypothetical protein [Sporolactobacillus terrae]BBN99612.1 hypothetical protein St703_23170 [Sporolactobacillus terrae]